MEEVRETRGLGKTLAGRKLDRVPEPQGEKKEPGVIQGHFRNCLKLQSKERSSGR